MPEDNRKAFRLLLVVGVTALLSGVLFAWSKPLFPLLAGFFIAYVSHPMASWFAKRRLPRIFGFVVTLLLLLAALSVFVFVFVPAVMQELAALGQKLPSWQEVLHERLQPFLADLKARYPQAFEELTKTLTGFAQERLSQLAPKLATWLAQAILSSLSVVSFLLGLVVALVIGAYLTSDFPGFVNSLRRLVPRPVLPLVERIALDIHEVLGAFAKGQLLVALALAGMYTLGLWLVGAPLALVVGPLAGLLSFIPYLGLVLGAGAAVLLSFLDHQDLLHPLLALAVFVVAQNIEGWVLTPKVVGKGVGLHPVWVLVSLLLGGELFGITGVMVAVPVAAALRVVLLQALRFYRTSRLFLGEPTPARLFTRPNCELCRELAASLAQAVELYGLQLEEVNVEEDPQLLALYGERVPVLEVLGQEVVFGRAAPEDLFTRLRLILGGERA